MRNVKLALLSTLAFAACLSVNSQPASAHGDKPHAPATTAAANPLDAILAGDWRSDKNKARDGYRHPSETLAFFGVKPDQKVIEIWPGGGWYLEVLAPLVREHGSYTAIVSDPAKASTPKAQESTTKSNQALRDKISARPEVYGAAKLLETDNAAPVLGAPGSADVVLTFRNAHNWVMAGREQLMFKAFFDVLAPGGTLGVVDHRAKPGTDLETMKKSGYLTEALVIELATRAGFVLEAKSEANANPADDADHPNGVWTLPPTNRHDAADDAKYQAIGESDRMTLRFRKPG